jgi:hypothetical protein
MPLLPDSFGPAAIVFLLSTHLARFTLKARRGLSPVLIVRALLVACLFLTTPTRAAEWWLEPILGLSAEYDDNPALTAQPHVSEYGYRISPSMDFGVRSNIWSVNGGAKLIRQSYSNRSSLDRDSQYYTLSSQYATERTTWQLDGNQSYASVLVNEAGDPDVGLLQLTKQRKSSGYAPSWSWAATERTQLQLRHQVSEVTYEDGSQFGLSDYHSSLTSGGISYRLSRQSRLSLNLSQSLFEVPSNQFESESTGAQAGITHSFSETLNTSFSVGKQRTKSEGFVQECLVWAFNSIDGVESVTCAQPISVFATQDRRSTTWSADLTKEFEATKLNLSLDRSENPSGTGVLVKTDTARLRISRDFTALLSGDLTLSYYDVKSTFGNVSGNDRNFSQINPVLHWKLTEEWMVDTSLSYISLKRDNEMATARGRSVLLTLTYRVRRMSISR